MFHARALRYLDAVARAGSIRKAAARLNVSPTAINKQILLVEDEFGTQLFHRLPRGLRLTAVGEILIEHVRRTLKDYERIAARVEDVKGLRGGQITIATMSGLAGGLVPRAVSAFCAKHPRVRVTTQVLFIREIVRAVLDGNADIGVGYNLPRDARLQLLDTVPAELGVVVTPSHPLAARSRIRLADCAAFPLVLPDASLVMSQTVVNAFIHADLPIEPTFQSNSIEFMKFMAAKDAIAFLSRFDVTEEIRAGTLVHLKTGSPSLAENNLSIICRSKGHLDTAANLFVGALRAHLQDADMPD
jgi:DNA-binding transcriptional LysR family regulator